MSAALLRAAAVVALACALTAGGSPNGPKLTGVDNEWNKGKPAGRSKGKTSNTQTARACKPNDVKAVNPRRERSSHDESIVASNMVSSLVEFGLMLRTPEPSPRHQPEQIKKAARDAAFWNFSDTRGVVSRYLGGSVDFGAAGFGVVPAAGLGPAGLVAAPEAAGAGTPDCVL